MKSPVSRKKWQFLVLSAMMAASMTVYAQDTTATNNNARQWQVTADQQAAASLAAQNGIHVSELREDAPTAYKVRPGDTLWSISGNYLKDPWKWPSLWGMNKNQISNPHRIYPGQILSLNRNGDRATLSISDASPVTYEGGVATVRLSPRVRFEDVDEGAIPVLPPEAVIPFMQHGVIVSRDEFANSPRVVSEAEGRLLLRTGDKVYVRGGDILNNPQKYYYAYSNPVEVKDPTTKKILGYEASYLGKLQLHRDGVIEPGKKEITSTFIITENKKEIRVGDRLTPANSEQDLLTDFVPSTAPATTNGHVVQLYGDSSFHSTSLYGVILLSQGQLDGLERGHVVALSRTGRDFKDTTVSRLSSGSSARTPDERYGLAMIFKVYDHLSYALVVQAGNTVEIGDVFTAP